MDEGEKKDSKHDEKRRTGNAGCKRGKREK